MRELLVRTVSGLLYVALIVFSACWSQPSFLIVLFVFSTLALIEFQKLIKHKSPVSFLLFGLLTYQFYTQNVHPTLHYGLLILTLLTSLYLTYCPFEGCKLSFSSFSTKWTYFLLPYWFCLFYFSHYFIIRCRQQPDYSYHVCTNLD
jgi:hypothetical protein